MIVFGADRKLQMMVQDDIALLVSDAVENPAAFGRLYDRFIQRIYRYVYSRVGNAPEAEDITSQTFIAAYESLGRYRERGQFSAWLFRIARSKMNDHFRRSRREVGLDAAERIVEVDDALGSLIQNEELIRLRSLIKKLNDDERELIRLRYVAELSFIEMAELLGKREDAVKKSVYRLLERLKGQME
jgi:RNA polymerase sigma-70 factor (ECF subfamily)